MPLANTGKLGLKNRRDRGAPRTFPFPRHLRHGHGIGRGGACASTASPSPARTRMSIRRCPPSSRERGITLTPGYRAENIPADADLVVIGNAITRGNPEVEAVLNRKLYYLSLPEVLKQFLPARAAQSRRHRHARENHHDLAARLDPERRRAQARLHDRRHPEESRPGRALQRLEVFRDRGRRIRHRVFRQALEVRPLPAGARDREQHRVRSRRYFRRSRRDQAELPPAAQHRAAKTEWCLLNGDDANCVEVAKELPRADRSKSDSRRTARNKSATSTTRPTARGSRCGSETFELPLIGEFNVRNAAMAITAARFYGVPLEKIAQGAGQFPRDRAAAGSARRSARRQSDRRFRASSDRHRADAARPCGTGIPGQRLWAVFEPRSNTTRRAVFQDNSAGGACSWRTAFSSRRSRGSIRSRKTTGSTRRRS